MLYCVYECDQWHMDKQLKCITETFGDAVDMVVENHEIEGVTDDELRKELEAIRQTQGHPVNYMIEAWGEFGDWN